MKDTVKGYLGRIRILVKTKRSAASEIMSITPQIKLNFDDNAQNHLTIFSNSKYIIQFTRKKGREGEDPLFTQTNNSREIELTNPKAKGQETQRHYS